MPKLQLKIRRMQSGEVVVAEFDGVDDAKTWLQARPRFVEVLRMVSAVAPEVEESLRAAMRPLDDEERARQLEIEAEVESRRAAELARLSGQGSAAADDPDRPLVVRWERAKGMWNADEHDDREISSTVRTAVLAWIAERDSWVHERGEHVAAASLTVWPNAIPSGDESERVQPGGQFVTSRRPVDTN